MNDSTLPKPTILIIDDSSELLEVFKMIFEKQGYNIITKTSFSNIFPILSTTKIDLLLLDVILNDMDGREICRQLKSNAATNYFPIIIMSASPENLIDAAQYGADSSIEKPFDINGVMEKVNSLVYKIPAT
jgi:DNA-binding response OmpR family regulator